MNCRKNIVLIVFLITLIQHILAENASVTGNEQASVTDEKIPRFDQIGERRKAMAKNTAPLKSKVPVSPFPLSNATIKRRDQLVYGMNERELYTDRYLKQDSHFIFTFQTKIQVGHQPQIPTFKSKLARISFPIS